jgi:hypothetical protein
MPQAPITPEQHRKILEVESKHSHLPRPTRAKMAGVSEGTYSKYRTLPLDGAPKPEPKPSKEPSETSEISGDKWTVSLPRTRIHTLEQLLDYCKVNLDLWEVERFVCNKWEMGYKDNADEGRVLPLFQVKAYLKRRKWALEAERIIERLRQKAESHSPQYPKIKTTPSKSGNVVEISPVDVHHGALIWGKETGGEDWDLKISENTFKKAVSALMSRTDDFKPEKALLVLGHDQQNSDNRAGMTEAGTPQNNDGRYQKVFDLSCDCSIWAIDACLQKYGEVEVFCIPGNHDPLATWHLGKVLQAWYKNVPRVTIRNSPNPRQYWEHGVNMLLLTHGNKGKLEEYGATMAAEQPGMWGRTRHREAHTGDKHQRRLIETKGATVRILPSLRPSCAWSAENHYIGSVRAAEAYVWNKDEGLVGTAMYSILQP